MELSLNSLGYGIVAVDKFGKVAMLNTQAEMWTGWNYAAALGADFEAVIKLRNEDTDELLSSPWTEVLEKPLIFRFEDHYTLHGRDEVPIRVNYYLKRIMDQSGAYAGVTLVLFPHSQCMEALKMIGEGNDCQPVELPKALPRDTFFVRQDHGFIKVEMQDVCWIEAMENYAILRTPDQKVIVHATMKSLEKKFGDLGFRRVHRSYIVRLEKIEAIDDKHLIIGTKHIPIGKSYRGALMKALPFFQDL